jgi:hypothetical protein
MATLDFDNWSQVKANLSQIRFDYKRLLEIATASKFDEFAAKQWVQDHFYLTLQASLTFLSHLKAISSDLISIRNCCFRH